MIITLFLAKLIGLSLIFASVSMLSDKHKMLQAIKSLLQDDGMLLVLELMSMVIGLAIILNHNIWTGGALPVVVTLFGWVFFVRGIIGLFISDLSLRKLYHLIQFEHIYYFAITILLILGGYLTYAGFKGTMTNTARATTQTGTKFADEPYAQYAYLIDPNNLTADAKLALTGFNLSQQALPSGGQQITLTALRPGYKTQVLDLQPGDQLYFIEKNLKDDSLADNDDATYFDDTAVVVDQNGYVLQSTSPTAGMPFPSSGSARPSATNGGGKVVNPSSN